MSLVKDLIKAAQQKLNTTNEYYPPNWQFNGLDFHKTIEEASKLTKKKKANLNKEELAIVENASLLRNCYGTTKELLSLGTLFGNGLFDQDCFYNPYSIVKDFSEENLITLDGHESNGFDLINWVGKKLIVNPPFARLSEAAELCNKYSQRDHKPFIEFICNLDFTNYFQECLKHADYLIIVGRIQFLPLPGLKNSQPTGSSAVFMYNSPKNMNTGFMSWCGKNYFVINLKK